MPTFGDQPSDVVANSRGDVLSGIVLGLYPTKADASASTNVLASVTTDASGRWSYTHATRTVVWVRTPAGGVYGTDDPASLDATALSTGTIADARLPVTAQAATLTSTYARHDSSPFNVKEYGALGNGSADDTTAIQAAITAAFAVGGTAYFPNGIYKITAALVTPLNTNGTVRLLGAGVPFQSSDGTQTGSSIITTSTTDSLFKATVTNTRQCITIEALTFTGNKTSGVTGHGLHFSAAAGTAAILVNMSDVVVESCKNHGLFFDGDVFESELFNIRAENNGGTGFAAVSNAGGLPGETRFYGCKFVSNNVGMSLSGGGSWSLFGCTLSYNAAEALIATSVFLRAYDFHAEDNSKGAGNGAGSWVTLNSLNNALISGIQVGGSAGRTGVGVDLNSCSGCVISGLLSSAINAGVGWRDFDLNTSTRCAIENYISDVVGKYALGSDGGHRVTLGGLSLTANKHPIQNISSSVSGTDTFDAASYNALVSTRTVAGISRDIRWPTPFDNAYYDGAPITIIINNASAGLTTTTWNAVWGLAGAWVDPAAGKKRSISFMWSSAIGGYIETSRTSVDI